MNIHSTVTGGIASATWEMDFRAGRWKRVMILRGTWMRPLLFEAGAASCLLNLAMASKELGIRERRYRIDLVFLLFSTGVQHPEEP